jgi:hypothetical protein
LSFPTAAHSQAPTGWQLSGIPAVNYNSDEGFGYGAILQLYHFGEAGKLPYALTLHPPFVVSLDAGHSKESALPIYIGLGFLF